MATTVAKTKQDVDNMSLRDRLYDSLNYSYGKKGERISSEYDKAQSAANRQALSRGMQRSYYSGQTAANIDKQRIDALNDNESALIADYENRLLAAEQQEAANEQWERQFAAGREDADWNKNFQQQQFDYNKGLNERNFAYQQERDKAADNQWQLTFNAGREDAAWNKGMQEKQYADQRADADWNKAMQERQYGDQRADVAYNRAFNEQQYADQRADTAWQQQFQTQQYADQRSDVAYNRAFNEQQYADQRADVAYNRAFNEQQYADQRADAAYNREFAERQFEAQQAQWREQFDYNRMSDEQKINYNWVTYSLQNGNDVSDEMLSKAGLTRDDYNKMKQQAKTVTVGSYRPGTTNPGDNGSPNGTQNPTDSSFNSDIFGLLNGSTGNTNNTQKGTTAAKTAIATGSGSTGLNQGTQNTATAPRTSKEIELKNKKATATGKSIVKG